MVGSGIKDATTHKYAVQIIKTENEPQINPEQNVQVEELVPYEGKIYCLEVPNHIIYVRRNGKPVWCGNSRHGQKGVFGMILPEEDMPFTVGSTFLGGSNSIRPDFIVNPHGFPSRMTLAQQIEMLLSKVVCVGTGKIADGTAFQGHMKSMKDEKQKSSSSSRMDEIYETLKSYGYQPHGQERMINGMTGEMIEASVFVCPVQYQRLRHMVQDKMHPRSVGPYTLLTRQPTEGRSRDGGLRFGEMEGHNIVSHGAAAVMKDRLFEQSDKFRVPVCKQCGLFAESREQNYPTLYCRNCDTSKYVIEMEIPYAFKLVLQEMQALHIVPRLQFEE